MPKRDDTPLVASKRDKGMGVCFLFPPVGREQPPLPQPGHQGLTPTHHIKGVQRWVTRVHSHVAKRSCTASLQGHPGVGTPESCAPLNIPKGELGTVPNHLLVKQRPERRRDRMKIHLLVPGRP